MQIESLRVLAHVRVDVGYIHGVAYGHQVDGCMPRRGSKHSSDASLESDTRTYFENVYELIKSKYINK